MPVQKKRNTLWSVLYGLLIIAIIAGGYMVFFRDSNGNYETVVVARDNIVREVTFTGTVVPADRVDLGFSRSGRVTTINADVGDTVYTGNAVAQLDVSSIRAQLVQARADLQAAEATLRKLERGTREEEIEVQRTKVTNAEIAYDDAKQGLFDAMQSAFTTADDVVSDEIDQFITNPDSVSPQIIFITDLQSEISLENSRVAAEDTFTEWLAVTNALNLESDLLSLSHDVRRYLDNTMDLFIVASQALDNAIPSGTASETTLATWLSEVGAARVVIDTEMSTLSTAIANVNTKKSSFDLAQEELRLLESGTIAEEIEVQEAVVASKQAQIRIFENDLSDSTIFSPITGVLSERSIDVGEIATANQPIFAVISEAAFEIEADVSELDISGIKTGVAGVVTLDTYGPDEFFETTVSRVDPAAIIVNSSPTYGVTLVFSTADPRIRAGMTANISVITGMSDDTLVIPVRALSRLGGRNIVHVYDADGLLVDKEVVVGLRGNSGTVEILEGVSEGDTLVVQ